MNEMAEYVSKVVERYDGDGYRDAPGSPRLLSVEIWNEPNIHWFWEPEPDPVRYTEMLIKSYLAAKYADPSTIVLGGGLAGWGVESGGGGELRNFLPTIYDNGAKNHFDVLGIHPYTFPPDGIETLVSRLNSTRGVMDSNGDSNIRIWLDEFGWPTSDEPMTWGRTTISNEEVAAWLSLVYTDPRVQELCTAIFWHSFTDHHDSPGVYFGLVKDDLSPKPQFNAYKDLPK